MKSKHCVRLLFLIAAAAFAEETDIVETADGVTRTAHFEVVSGGSGGTIIARQMEERFTVYNRLFRFDPAELAGPLRVRIFRYKDEYTSYLAPRLGDDAPGAVYLHYGEREKRELLIFQGAPDEERVLPYQAFLQFFRAFISRPPAWMREGFAVFFSGLEFSGEGKLVFKENLAWLETVKNMKDRPRPEDILLAESSGAANSNGPEFQALAWSLVSFFLNSGKETYARSLTDSFMALADANTAAQNAEAVMKRIALGNTMDDLARDYQSYLDSRKTFAELVDEGQKAYAAADARGAELAFRAALDQNPGHYAPYYYLGLLAYNAKNYDEAEENYFASMGYGADSALVLYALGLNAAAAGNSADAVDFLRQAAAAAPDRYREKAESLIARLGAVK